MQQAELLWGPSGSSSPAADFSFYFENTFILKALRAEPEPKSCQSGVRSVSRSHLKFCRIKLDTVCICISFLCLLKGVLSASSLSLITQTLIVSSELWPHHHDRRQQHPLIGPHAVAVAVLGPEWAGLSGHRPVQVSQNPALSLSEAAGVSRPAGKNPGRTAAPAEPQEEGRARRWDRWCLWSKCFSYWTLEGATAAHSLWQNSSV